jgi:hypothetical protein
MVCGQETLYSFYSSPIANHSFNNVLYSHPHASTLLLATKFITYFPTYIVLTYVSYLLTYDTYLPTYIGSCLGGVTGK